MDELTSIISFNGKPDEYDAFYFQPSTNPLIVSPQQQNIKQDLGVPDASLIALPELESNHDLAKREKQQKTREVLEEDGNGSGVGKKEKKVVHREIERVRRQEMANLYSSLRTLLPLEYIKGKRSLFDQINESIKYIKYKEKNIEQLKSKRDKLRNLLNIGSDNIVQIEKVAGTSRNSSPIEISIRPCSNGGFEILIRDEIGKEKSPLSSVLEVLVEEGLTVVSCFYTKLNDKFLHTIQTEPSHNVGIDIRDLPRKLSGRIKAPVNFKCCSIS